MIDSFHPLQETICKRVQVWARRGSKVELPVLYPYNFNIGKTFKVKRYRVKVEGSSMEARPFSAEDTDQPLSNYIGTNLHTTYP